MSDKPKLTVAEIERLRNTQKVKNAVHVPLLPSDKPIPERWKAEHQVCGVGYRTVIEELGAAEAALSEAQQATQSALTRNAELGFDLRQLQQQLSEATQELADNLIAFTSMNSMIIKLHDERDSLEISIEGYEQQVTQQAATIGQLRDALCMLYDKYEDGDPCTENGDENGSPLGNAISLSFEEESRILKLIPKQRKANLPTGEPK